MQATLDDYAAPLHDLTGFQRDLLAVVVRDDGSENLHGLAIKKELDRVYETDIFHGRLYPNLDTLVEKGLIQKGEIDDRTNYYKVTRLGRREFKSHLDWLQTDG